MKILVTGTYSSGKTSFCQRLLRACELENWNTYCPVETARVVNLPINMKQDGEASSFLLGMQFSRECELVDLFEVLICDRGLPDIWSHNLLSEVNGRGIANPSLKTVCDEWAKTYDIIIQSVVNDEIEIPADGLRVVDTTYRKKLELFHRKAMFTLSITPAFTFDHTEDSIKSAIHGTINHLRESKGARIS